jgi:hypothetical protein
VINELFGFERVVRADWPQDGSMHDARGSMLAMKQIAESFMPNQRVDDRVLEPGDVIVVGPHGGGPGHGMIVGSQKNTLWHSADGGVQFTGISYLWVNQLRVFRVYRYLERYRWLNS